jgi:hypothetical protein
LGRRNALKDVIKVNVPATNGNHGTLEEVCAKAGDFTKAMKDGRQVLNVLLDGGNKDSRIIRIKRGAENASASPNFVKEPLVSGGIEDLGKRINGEHKEERREGVPLPKTSAMLDGRARDAIEEHPRGGGG